SSFFYPIPPPPLSPLFPYTTLFRSGARGHLTHLHSLALDGVLYHKSVIGGRRWSTARGRACSRRNSTGGTRSSSAARASGSRTADRKSTRLNSSHDQISYAVFCLKK